MPIFDYTCQSCNNTFEKIVLKADMVVECPSCGSTDVKKNIVGTRASGIRITGMQRFINNGKARHKGDW